MIASRTPTLRRIPALRLSLALLAVLAAGMALFSHGAAARTQRAPGPTPPAVSLSMPAELTRGEPALARGKVTPPKHGRVLLQVGKAGAWRSVAAGKVRRGRFRISFVPGGALPSQARMRAALVQARGLVATSGVEEVRIGPASPAPGPVAQPLVSSTAPSSQSPATGSGGGQSTPPSDVPPPKEPPPGEEEPPDEEEPPPGEEPPTETPPPADAYWGAWIGSHLTGTAAPWDMSAVSEFEQLTGKPLSMIEFSSPFSDCSKSPCSYYSFPWDPFNSIRAYGAIPFFSWGSQAIPGTPTQPDFQLADIIAGAHDGYIRAWATRAAEWGHPFFLRFDWEMNGDWFPWGEGVNGNQPGEFAAAWRHVHDIFTSVGATNATWVWCPYANHLNLYASLYPGDSYVDWTCLDGYNWGTNPAAPYGWRTFDSVYGNAYAKVIGTVAPSKPMVIGEMASSEYGGSKATWIDEMFEALPARYPQIRGLLWFETLSNGMDWPLESSESATEAFATGIDDSRYLGNEFGALSASPIPPP